MLTPTLLAAIAGGRSSFGTSCGTTACQAGTVSAPAAPIRNVNSEQIAGRRQAQSDHHGVDRDTAVVSDLDDEQIFALVENVGQRAGRQRQQKDRQTCSPPEPVRPISGLGSRVVISQPEAALYIQPPTLETSVAVQITANAGWRKGAVNDAAFTGPAAAVLMQFTPAAGAPSIGPLRRPETVRRARH